VERYTLASIIALGMWSEGNTFKIENQQVGFLFMAMNLHTGFGLG
jgi:hypothetical protein